jgi:hypothetical protein
VEGLVVLAMLPRWKLGEFWSNIWALLLPAAGTEEGLTPVSRVAEK